MAVWGLLHSPQTVEIGAVCISSKYASMDKNNTAAEIALTLAVPL